MLLIELPLIIRITFKEIFQEIEAINIRLQETVISECEEEKGEFLCGPEWRVRITTKGDQHLQVQQVKDGEGVISFDVIFL